ncbi:hypothetical protein PVAG01_11122 [Phlyctema vagabunda]|uniref:Uncharacterized protein n=1 Tax=Phlyctema vagabunda TaxID=108571 RepID=A0ABR4P1D9_9HELO
MVLGSLPCNVGCTGCHLDFEHLPESHAIMANPLVGVQLFPGMSMVPMSGVRCPTCLARGQEVWVIPGRACGYCGTGC